MQRLAVFLGRDGVINRYAYDPKWGTFDAPSDFDGFELLPGAAEAIASLNRLKIPVIVVSNQPGIAKGRFTTRQLDAINEACAFSWLSQAPVSMASTIAATT